MSSRAEASGARVLVVGCGFPQLGLLRAARALGLHVIGADANPGAIGVAECQEFVEVSTNDPDGIARALRSSRADGLTTCGSEIALHAAACVAESTALPFYADRATVERCQHKDQMREAYRMGGAPIPRFVVAERLAQAQRFASEAGLPLVLKPSRGWGQRGVSKVETESELAPAFEAAQRASTAGLVLVESFIEGEEFSVNAYTLDGATKVYSVTERVITSYPDPPGITFAEWYPCGLSSEAVGRAIDAAVAGVRALGIQRGPSYTQLRVGPKGAAIVETAHRLGGGLDPDVALLASGVSLYRKILGVALGRADWEREDRVFDTAAPDVYGLGREGETWGGAIGKFLVGRPGRVVAIRGLDEARRVPGVVAAEVYVSVGGVVLPLTDGSKRAGHVLARGKSRDDARDLAERAAAMIQIETVVD